MEILIVLIKTNILNYSSVWNWNPGSPSSSLKWVLDTSLRGLSFAGCSQHRLKSPLALILLIRNVCFKSTLMYSAVNKIVAYFVFLSEYPISGLTVTGLVRVYCTPPPLTNIRVKQVDAKISATVQTIYFKRQFERLNISIIVKRCLYRNRSCRYSD
jgi:hypothetical protein